MDIQEFNFNVDVLQAIIWQYDSAPNLRSIIESESAWYETNQATFWNDWIVNVFDLGTANDFGLQVWSIILQQSLYTSYSASPESPYFGFGADNQNFGVYNFASQNGGTNIYSTEIARLLLRLRYFQLTSSGTIPETNRMLAYLFSDYGAAYLIDNLNMTQTYYFDFVIPAEMLYMLENSDVLPRPAGVQNNIIDLSDLITDINDELITDSNGNYIFAG
jgi:hypothetical protein